MPGLLARKLQGFADLSAADCAALDYLSARTRDVRPGEGLVSEGGRPQHVHLLLEGWAFRYKSLPEGTRQILAYLIPGDLCDIHIFILKKMDHGLAMLSSGVIAEIEPDEMLAIMDDRPNIARALWWATLVDEAILREWLVNQARRDARDGLGHLFCEMWFRMNAVGLAEPGVPFSLPLTQLQLGDTLGLTPVSVNRALQSLRALGLISLDAKRLTIHRPAQLVAMSGFEPNYLHLSSLATLPHIADAV